jgi:hypothetical protein
MAKAKEHTTALPEDYAHTLIIGNGLYFRASDSICYLG